MIPTDGPRDVQTVDRGDVGSMCVPGQTSCGTSCVSLQTDPMNCGTCGTMCATLEVCTGGMCQSSCVTGQTVCPGTDGTPTCTTTATDRNNCGACGTTCRAGEVCSAGVCASSCGVGLMTCPAAGGTTTCADTTMDRTNCGTCGNMCPTGQSCVMSTCRLVCPSALMACGAVCVDLMADTANCGACGTACTGGQSCVSGMCLDRCMTGMTDCGGACVLLSSDPNNCGACGNACTGGLSCTAGMCRLTCPAGQTACGSTCHDLQSDVANCGACGTACAGGQVCRTGACSTPCPAGQTSCSGVCRDVQTDVSNCGGCGNVCAPGANATASCGAGTCQLTCSANFGNCDGSAANGCEANLLTTNANCGMCGNACPAGQTCTGGTCPVPTTNNECAGATAVALLAGTTTVSGSTATATHSASNTCGSTAPDVWYSFTLAAREMVYVDSFGSAYDTMIGLYASCGAAYAGCNDDAPGCGGLQSQVAAVLPAGTHYISVGGFSSNSGAYTLHIQHLPVSGPTAAGVLAAGSSTPSGNTTGQPTLSVGCGAAGATNWYYFLSCPSYTGGTFTATTCTRASFDTVLAFRNGNAAGGACNDDNCGLQSTISGASSAGAGLHVFYASSYSTNAGAYSVAITRP